MCGIRGNLENVIFWAGIPKVTFNTHRLAMKSILFALAAASVALVVNSAPSFNKEDGIDLISKNTDFSQILSISKRSIIEKQKDFATNAKTGHGGINKKAKQIANAARRREERAERRKNGEHRQMNAGSESVKVQKNVVRTVKSEGKKKKTGKGPCGRKVCGKKKKYRKKVKKLNKKDNKDAEVQVRFGHHGGHHNYGKK